MMFWYGGGWLWWQVALMWVGMLAFWGLLIWAIYALATGARRTGDGHNSGSGEARHGGGALEILDERLARGEIDAAEYQRLRGLISSGDRQQARTEADNGASAHAGSGSLR